MTTEKQILTESIDGLYAVFSIYPLAQEVEGCPCCVSGWRSWPREEQQAVASYFSALWQWLLALPVEEWVLDDYLYAIGQAEDNLDALYPKIVAKINTEGSGDEGTMS